VTADPVTIERLADAAWPAAERERLGPWTLRATSGVTRRANSVFTAGGADVSGAELERLVEAAERYYAGLGQPAVFQISAATGARGLDEMLERRGYRVDGASEVWCADVDGASRDARIVRAEEPGEDWFDVAFDEPEARRRVHEQIVRRAPGPRVFLSAVVDGVVAACAMAVSGEGYTGLFCMTTREAYRRRGLGRALVGEVLAWARERGDQLSYLQVMQDNKPAKGLYREAGFNCIYHYYYRVK
jgi:ribosomal protein S18 acetylase RimI-like enzyme